MAMAQSKPSRAQLRINAMRQMTGGKRVVPKDVGKASDYIHKMPSLKELKETPEVNFASNEYSVLESGGQIVVSVVRLPPDGPFTVKYVRSFPWLRPSPSNSLPPLRARPGTRPSPARPPPGRTSRPCPACSSSPTARRRRASPSR
jgi:hypothetical protein